MQVRLHDDLAAFARLSGPLLHADPVRHTIAVSLLASRLRPGSPDDVVTMLTVHDTGGAVGAALGARGLALVASALPPSAAPAAAAALAVGRSVPAPDVPATGVPAPEVPAPDAPVPGVTGPRENAEAFAAAWCRCTGDTARVEMTMRLFALEELRPPAGVPGAPRVAGPADLGLLARWRRDFAQAALPSVGPPGHDIEATVARQLLAGQGNILWEVDGEPVAVAAASAPAAGMSRLAAVWTPPQRRGHGFGSAVTAAASTWALDAGAVHVVLFTDLDNPVTNAIYPRLGYRPVYDAVDLAFERRVGRT